MTRLVLLAIAAGCTASVPVGHGGEAVSVGAGTIAAPSPVSTLASRTVPRASRSRRPDPRSETGSQLTSTSYCETGLMANGHRTHKGAVAANDWPIGTVLRVSDSPYGPGLFTVEDRYGWGTSLDFSMPGDCAGARAWGRRTITVEVAA